MLKHGGNLREAAKQYGIPLASWLDLSTGINPQHYPITNIEHISWQRLPEDNDGLIEAACAYYDCHSLLPTAGSQAALQLLPQLREHCHIAMPNTMYQEHAHAWQQCGHQVTFFNGSPDAGLLNKVDALLVCNPNNPTGKRISKTQLLQWHQTLSSHGGWLIVDEAFMDTSPDDSVAGQTYLAGLFVLRSLGKFFGLAGARVGFLLAQTDYLTKAQAIMGPWALAGPSRAMAKAALEDKVWQDTTRLALKESSQRLKQLLSEFNLNPSSNTDLFQYVPTKKAVAIQRLLAQQGIWVRLFEQPAALRFGLPPEDHWDDLVLALKNCAIGLQN